MNIEHIRQAILAQRKNFAGSDAAYATYLGISAAGYSRIQKGDVDKVLSEAKWLAIANQLGIDANGREPWKLANTPVFAYITAQLKMCQTESMSLVFCDSTDIGKTFAAKKYALENKNVAYIDCSQCKSKSKFIKSIAKAFGVDVKGRYDDIYEALVGFLQSQIIPPLVILDEAGDLENKTFLETKSLWNASEGKVGWFMMGADGLKAKIERSIECKSIGFAEIFSRFGSKFQRGTPEGREDRAKYDAAQASAIIKANLPTGIKADINKIIAKAGGSLRRIKIEIAKLNAAKEAQEQAEAAAAAEPIAEAV